MTSIAIKKGLDIQLGGHPKPEIVDVPPTQQATVFPQEIQGIKPRLLIKEGDQVKKGTPLLFDKRRESFQLCAPIGGHIQAIVLGERRSIQQIVIEKDGKNESEEFKKYTPEKIRNASREDILTHLDKTGYISFIKQRPFSNIANPTITPKSIFINAMNTAPFQPSAHIAIQGNEQAFELGISLLTRLTKGKVHLCVPSHEVQKFSVPQVGGEQVKITAFSGPHPSGNSSTHIYHLDPIKAGDQVWAIKASELVLIGKLFLDGQLPESRIISLAGLSVKEESRKYYRLSMGQPLDGLLDEHLINGEHRVIDGDVLSGVKRSKDTSLHLYTNNITVIPESRERFLLGWMAPGLSRFSTSRLFLSKWLKPNHIWNLTSNQNGSHRAMVMTEIYDRYMPLNIKVDFLVKAVLAHDSDEAIKLGILETDPEDFALPSLVCPSKIDLLGIIQRGLKEIEEEGL